MRHWAEAISFSRVNEPISAKSCQLMRSSTIGRIIRKQTASEIPCSRLENHQFFTSVAWTASGSGFTSNIVAAEIKGNHPSVNLMKTRRKFNLPRYKCSLIVHQLHVTLHSNCAAFYPTGTAQYLSEIICSSALFTHNRETAEKQPSSKKKKQHYKV